MKKQSIVIIGVIAFVLALAVGYALFSKTLTITGVATASGDFDVEFTEIGEITSSGYTKQVTEPDHQLAEISSGKDELTINVNKLDYPGAYVEIPVTITNKGSIPAKLKQIKQTGLDTEEGPIKVTYTGVATTDEPINQNETKEMTIRVEWLENVDETASNAEFTITLEYEQIEA